MTVEELTIPSGPYRLAGLLHTPPAGGPFATIVACHGLLSSKESRKYAQLARMAVDAGLALVRFDFRAVGGSTGGAEALTLSGRLQDLRAVLGFLKSCPAVDATRIGLMGSSLGGVVAWAVGRSEPSVGAVAVWSTPSHLHDLLGRRGQVGPGGGEPLPESFFDDLEGHDLLELPAGLARVLVVHGEEDELVPLAHAHRLYALAGEPKRLVILPGADHRLSGAAHRLRATEETVRWFSALLGPTGPTSPSP